ncbi:hypothetical protein P8935_13375 [Telmatobacter sp. DSM 110680]|uniref:Uncharacterized protein n=1 Tax=Telmatobacter sp. DSM 110680 TaxID=3036704 RepID=A0AAU7DEQ6_9BACT
MTHPVSLCSTAINVMHNLSLNAIAGHAVMYPALPAGVIIPAIRISNHIMCAGRA